jgi:hypothetical protein
MDFEGARVVFNKLEQILLHFIRKCCRLRSLEDRRPSQQNCRGPLQKWNTMKPK